MKRALIILCIGMLLLSGCHGAPPESAVPELATKKELPFTFRGLLSGMELELTTPLLISSLQELEDFEQQREVDLSIDLPDGEPYTEVFFGDSVLLLIEGSCPFIPQAFWVEQVKKEGKHISVCAVQGAPIGGDEAFGHCLMGVELKKADAEGCTFSVEFREQDVILAY